MTRNGRAESIKSARRFRKNDDFLDNSTGNEPANAGSNANATQQNFDVVLIW